jgi:hypothetical protein
MISQHQEPSHMPATLEPLCTLLSRPSHRRLPPRTPSQTETRPGASARRKASSMSFTICQVARMRISQSSFPALSNDEWPAVPGLATLQSSFHRQATGQQSRSSNQQALHCRQATKYNCRLRSSLTSMTAASEFPARLPRLLSTAA